MVLPRTEAKARRQLGKLQEEVRTRYSGSWPMPLISSKQRRAQHAPVGPYRSGGRNLSEWNPVDGAGLSFALQPDLPLVHLDLEQMQHLLRNIVALLPANFGARPTRSTWKPTARASGWSSRLCPRRWSMRRRISSRCSSRSDRDFPPGPAWPWPAPAQIAEAHGATIEMTSEPPHSLTLLISFPKA